MKTEIIILVLFSASVYGQACPDCPDIVFPPDCGIPDCSLPQNHQNHALFPHENPNFFWQCMPWNASVGWVAMKRPCACGTVFNPNVAPPRCTFWFESTWQVQCNWTRPPILSECDAWCPDCGPDLVTPAPPTTPGPGPTTQPPPTTPGPTPGPTPPPCNCPCIPCIWWPCIPCNPCACNST